MPRFADVVKGKRARKTIALSLPNASEPAAEEISLDVRVLTGDEEALVLESARAWATSKGVADPKPGDPLYDLGLMVYTVLAACVDTDSPVENPRSFFVSVEEILGSLDRDRITYLYEQHELWQDACSPYSTREPHETAVWAYAIEVAESESPLDRPFANTRPAMRWSFERSMARLLLSSLKLRSLSGSSSVPDSTGATQGPTEAS